jgi:hypothetical protein
MVAKESLSLRPLYSAYAQPELNLESLLLFFKEFQLMPSVLKGSDVICIFDSVIFMDGSQVSRHQPGHIALNYNQVNE